MGAAGIGSLTDIIVADLVPLKDRGNFMGYLSAIWAVAAAIGPSIGKHISLRSVPHGVADLVKGGVFAQKLSWRWLFCEYIHTLLTCTTHPYSRPQYSPHGIISHHGLFLPQTQDTHG